MGLTQSQIRQRRNTSQIAEMLGDYLQMKKEERDLYKPKDKQLRSVGDALLEYNPNDGTTRTIAEATPKDSYGFRTVGNEMHKVNTRTGDSELVTTVEDKDSYSLRKFGDEVHRINTRTGKTEFVKTIEDEGQPPSPYFTHVKLSDGTYGVVDNRTGKITSTGQKYPVETNPWRDKFVTDKNTGKQLHIRYNTQTGERNVEEFGGDNALFSLLEAESNKGDLTERAVSAITSFFNTTIARDGEKNQSPQANKVKTHTGLSYPNPTMPLGIGYALKTRDVNEVLSPSESTAVGTPADKWAKNKRQ